MISQSSIATVLAATYLIASVESFLVNSRAPNHISYRNMDLNLVPSQGSQLVAAWTAKCDRYLHDDNNNDDDSVRDKTIKMLEEEETESNRSFVSKVFSLPAKIREKCQTKQDDVVLYPLVGFTFVKDSPDHCSILATRSNVACPLHNEQNDEELYGWYSAACHLNPKLEDDCYCVEPASEET